MQRLFLAILCFVSINVLAQQVKIVPEPAEMVVPAIKGGFTITPQTVIVLQDSSLVKCASFFNDYLQQLYGFTLKVAGNNGTANTIKIFYSKIHYPLEGAYNMQVSMKEINIAADNAIGAFYGVQTLIQLLPISNTNNQISNTKSLLVPYVSINDYPRFAYRGLHLDVARHFFPLSFIKKYIDFIAFHKMNVFHWHLSDDQGWRIEIKKYPKLTEVGAWRNGTIVGRYPGKGNDSLRYGGFYTQQEIKDVVQYAADRFVTIIPEIDIPGHSSAAIAAYPQLSCFPDSATQMAKGSFWSGPTTGKQVQQTWGVFDDVLCPSEYTFAFFQDVLDEVMQLFPSTYIHIGGDECPKTAWKRSAFCQQLIKEKNLKDEHGLQSYFIERMEKYINSKDRRVIGWDEILEGGLAPNASVMSWRGEQGGIDAATQNHLVVMTPGDFVYFDHSQSKNEDSVTIGGYTSLQKVYSYEPIPEKLAADKQQYVLGAQANVWSEYITNPSKVEYMIFPRLSALSEVLWSPKEKRIWKNFETKIPVMVERYAMWHTNYSRAYYDIQPAIEPTTNNEGVLWKLSSKSTSAKINHYNTASGINTATVYNDGVLVKQPGTWAAVLMQDKKAIGKTIYQSFSFNKATGKKIVLIQNPTTKYPGNGGAFGLINGAKSANGISSPEWLGWEGGNCEAVIDLAKNENVQQVKVHTLEQIGSWIYRPSYVEVWTSTDGTNFSTAGKTTTLQPEKENMGYMVIDFTPVNARYIKILVKEYGIIEDGKPGAGNKAWLFVDEIEVN